MATSEYSLVWQSDAKFVDDIRQALEGVPYDEVETRGADGTIHGVLWMIAIQAAKPVLDKVEAFVDKHLTLFMQARKIGEVTIKRDGQVVIKNASPAQIEKVLREIREHQNSLQK